MNIRSITDSIAYEVSNIKSIFEDYFCERFNLTPDQADEYFDLFVTVPMEQALIIVTTDFDSDDEVFGIVLELDAVVQSIQPGCCFVEERPGVWVCRIYLT